MISVVTVLTRHEQQIAGCCDCQCEKRTLRALEYEGGARGSQFHGSLRDGPGAVVY